MDVKSEQLHLEDVSSIPATMTDFKCKSCKKKFSVKEDLIVHICGVEVKVPFECVECPSTFTDVDDFKKHILIHAGERPYKCKVCQKAFFFEEYLKVHMERHIPIGTYKCCVCKKRFSYKVNTNVLNCKCGKRKFHMCDKCNVSYKKFRDNQDQSMLFTRKEIYVCMVCPRSFPNQLCFLNHLFVHAKAFPTSHLQTRKRG